MKKKIVVLMLALTSAVFSVSARDILSLKNGSVIKGELVEATGEQVKFKTADGSLWVYSMGEVLSLSKEQQEEAAVAENTPKQKVEKKYSTKGYRTQVEQVLEGGDYLAFGYDAIFGYQFNSHLQLGGGTGVRVAECIGGNVAMPLYVDFKVNFLKTKVTPFFDVRGGALLFLDEGGDATGYFSSSLGVKIHFTKARALSISTGLAVTECEGSNDYYHHYYYDYDGNYHVEYSSYPYYYTGCAFSFNINYQF